MDELTFSVKWSYKYCPELVYSYKKTKVFESVFPSSQKIVPRKSPINPLAKSGYALDTSVHGIGYASYLAPSRTRACFYVGLFA